MDYLNPIFTEKAECQDCYKCVRECPVKAIKVENGQAEVIQDRCIYCGHCVEICPSGAKRVRNDVGRVRQVLELKEKVVVSIAPSYVSEFPDIRPEQLIHAIKKLGFYGVSETALGAQEVSANSAELIKKSKGKVFISSACPSVVEFLKKYQPLHAYHVTNMLSPLLSHCKMLKREFGDDIGVVFIGPCISKKRESDSHQELLDVSITFNDLRDWFKHEQIDPAKEDTDSEDGFIPERAFEGSLYPIDGGMIAGIKADCTVKDACFMAFSGIEQIKKALEGLDTLNSPHNIFIELLACEGGCVNGPQACKKTATALKRFNVISNTEYPEKEIPRKPSVDIHEDFKYKPVVKEEFNETEIREELKAIGKEKPEDELNCGGCGYDSCREFAQAMLEGKAERTMCLSYMRKLAQKKANALIRTMPSGVVIVDYDLKIIECNKNFASLFGTELEMVFDAAPGMKGAELKKIINFEKLFRNVLDTGNDIVNKDINIRNTVLNVSIFTIEPNRIVGGILHDITEPAIRKTQIINKTQQVIRKNLQTVQKIAYLLGENAAESEVILNSIIDSFCPESLDDEQES